MNEQPLTKKQKKQLKKERQRQEKTKELRKKKIKNTAIVLSVVLAIILVGYFLVGKAKNIKILPPTSLEGHIEQSPPSHILSESMPENIQKHMLEHADGGGPPGVIVQYNCEKFSCEDGLVQKLTAIIEEYPRHVYLAPSSRYDGKIILTKFGKREILEKFDEQIIKDFIEE